ncbi:hypothetical protein, partial [Moraxella catarrhalis]|uniref:hypothetical protein n=1 Tax=Moraxella catarrhalis TaxID=480 RepID=UPI001883C0D3
MTTLPSPVTSLALRAFFFAVVTAKKNARKANEVTGLGKVVKTAATINKEQVLNIRDLTRSDPGIAVVEQGRGASSDYSIGGRDSTR